ncbi:MAG: AbrB family transcriptional regulator [Polaromonas sp. 39-63-203]|jgi:AbrB family looped-hinge helix DNA binding protein|uniref:AbrB/MazE/SpoVT family DNA-binding domain-containing protein n=1 Tax=Polaromonas sp. TaxID=1869339 RepID=UPI000BDC92D3|nr:type II toxin-antitoxin system PrlF family antitoxin [Polaromonas sp.]OYY51728.1 MAG: AbrB family transcriptional regulator [Polaromonas sp. 35-63-240]OYY95673.1 MAG: AbrB family transcriptional regulator [Polaromonas sp. 28-63-22]OYZ83310.1 MAG: AbrB family transcriptional regulator [Polaromonas sp. 24-62-144]OZA96631.1 MAG: AbrB family transcriptional regulator [Polaromonas sp. 39-63-203]HQS31091.1 type II toxin-antitoxin system PrlF family antitoxin [Polaromonas sp.]
MLQTSKLTTKFQTTVPTRVRKILQLKAGDMVGFEIDGNEVRLRRATPLDLAFTQALEGTLTEWSSKADDRAFKDL